jgi:hypothetical protein
MENNNLRRELAKYKMAASSQFHNATGDETGNFAQALDLNDRTLTVNITPVVSTVGGTAIIFGANLYPDEVQNTANNMVVAVNESSHKAAKSYSIGNPWRFKGLLYDVSDVRQFAYPLHIIYQTVTGRKDERQWQPNNKRTPMANIATLIDARDFQCVIDGDTRIEIYFMAGQYGTLTFTINDKLEISQALSNKTPIKSA